MRIVHVEDFFHPSAGYQVNILAKYMQARGHEVIVLTSKLDIIPDYLVSFFGKDDIEKKDDMYFKKYGVKICRIPALKYISGRVIFGNILTKTLRELNPDIVFAHGNDTASSIQLIYYCSRKRIPIISDSHMLEMASNNRFSPLFKFAYRHTVAHRINHKGIKVIRTQDSDYVNRCLGVKSELTPYIPLGSDLMMFKPDAQERKKTREELKISDDSFVVIYAGKIDRAKGGLFLADAIIAPIQSSKETVFLLVGNPSGEDKTVIENRLSESQNKLVRVGTQPYINLAKYYQASDIAVFPKQCSLSFYDVQATGLPVVFEDNDINIKRSEKHNAVTFRQSDISDFRKKIEFFANMNEEEITVYRNNAMCYIRENYNYEKVSEMYLDVMENEYTRIINNRKAKKLLD